MRDRTIGSVNSTMFDDRAYLPQACPFRTAEVWEYWVQLATTSEEIVAFTDLANYYYLITAIIACNEGAASVLTLTNANAAPDAANTIYVMTLAATDTTVDDNLSIPVTSATNTLRAYASVCAAPDDIMITINYRKIHR